MLVTLTLRCGPEAGAGSDAAGRTDPAVDDADLAMDKDVVVSGPDGTTLGAVAAKLAALVGRPGADLYAGSTLLIDSTPFGAPGLRDGCIIGVGRAGPRPELSAGVLELRVVSGADAGAAMPLARGEHVIGRGSDCAIQLADPLASRRHAVLQVSADGIGVRDLGATNRSRLDGRQVGGAGASGGERVGRSEPFTAMAPGQLLRIGDTVLCVAVPDGLPATTRRSPGGTLRVDRPPRVPRTATGALVDWPRPPEPRPPARLPVIALILPLVAGVVLAVLFDRPEFLLFTLLSPLMMLGNFLSDRSGRRRGRSHDLRDHADALRRAEGVRDRAVARDCLARRRDGPDPAALAAIAHGPGQRLWERRPGDLDFGLLRLGTGTVPTDVLVRVDGVSRPWPAADLPVTVPLAEVGVLGLAGPDRPLLALARSLVCQLAVLHSPRELGVLLVATGGRVGRWGWLRWLPHRRRAPPLADLVGLLEDRLLDDRWPDRPGSGGRLRPPDLVLVLPDAGRLRAEPAVARLLAEGPAVGIVAICLDREARRLPAECVVVGAITGDIGSRIVLLGSGRPANAPHDDAVPPGEAALLDGISEQRAERIARALAPLRDPGGHPGQPPREVRLLDLLGLTDPAACAVTAAWAGYDGVPRLTLGHDGRAPCIVDLVRDGPHTLIAGTTGAGKSELLQTLVAGLAASAPPDALQFVLVDYKGGAAFRDCARLPHTSGLVTDLDEHLTRRALRSLSAELLRRERLLATVGATDLAGYDAARRTAARGEPAAGTAPLARLMIVVDEFAALARELPDFIGGLVSIAARGRSLGIHLVLATQRPGGVVTPEVRANTSLRIALRVTDEGESRDVIEQAGAARISRHTPGRALIRSGTEPATLVQTARIAGYPPRRQEEVRVALVDGPPVPAEAVAASAPRLASPPTGTPAATAAVEPTDLEQLVTACRAAAADAGFAPLPSPWLPPLPEVLRHDDLPAAVAGAAVLGLVDHPDAQARTPLGFDPVTDTSLVLAGGPGSGRTTALRTLLAALAQLWSADDLHMHVLDCGGGGLGAAARLPHCGTAVGREDTARGRRLLIRLVEELEARQSLLARSGLGSLTEYRTGPSGSRTAPPYVLLVLDGWETFVQTYEAVDNGQPVESLLRLVREGGAAGLRVVIASGRAGLGVRLSGVVGRRIVLPLADPADYALAGIPLRAVPAHRPPGRGLVPGPQLECQLAVIGADPSGAAQTAALLGYADAGACARRHLPLSITELPRCITLDRLPPAEPRRPPLGVGGDAAAARYLPLDTLGPAFLVAGPPRSGRTTTLLTLVHGLLCAGTPPVVVASRRSPLRMLPGLPAVAGPADVTLVREHLAAGATVVLADDIESLVDAPIDGLLTELVEADDGTVVIGAGRAEDLAGAFRGVGIRLRRRRTGLLLNPGPLDGELLGVRLPRGLADRIPGRGWLVEHGNLTRIQVALPPDSGIGPTPGGGRPPTPAGRRSP